MAPLFLKRFSIIHWIRRFLSKVQKKPSNYTTFSHEDDQPKPTNEDNQLNALVEDGNLREVLLLESPPSRFRSSRQVVDSDGWTTIRFLDNHSDSDSDEIRPLIREKPPTLPQFVKKVRGLTHMAEHTFIPVKENTIPLIDMDSSSYLMDVAGISGLRLESSEENVARATVKFNRNTGDVSIGEKEIRAVMKERSRRLVNNPNVEEGDGESSSDSSDPSVISYLQKRYGKRAERKRKYEALHELRTRVSQRLQLNRIPSSYSSLTSDGGDFELNLPSKFYRKLGLTSKRKDEERRRKASRWLANLRQLEKAPVHYVIQAKKNVGKFRREHIHLRMFRQGR
ncbi:unnamed protein product [Orchesella dallaii]|uniref:Uncharacterized protein n=1 Tax=Orchesella dallaii TaxID=48710 RepID=A0ABP1Q3S3_9HEXA